jgi:predicted RNA binding protein YcfA (HicA-like mRNA interferase family)
MRFKALPAEEVLRILETLGFEKIRQKGSHVFLRHSDGRATVVPVHRGEEIGRGLLSQIIKDAKLTKEEFLKALQEKKATINEAHKKSSPHDTPHCSRRL